MTTHSQMHLIRVFVTEGENKGQLRFIPLHQIAELRLFDATVPEAGILVRLVDGSELEVTVAASVKRLLLSVGVSEHEMTLTQSESNVAEAAKQALARAA